MAVKAATPPSGHGLLGMRERVAAGGGTLEVGPRTTGPGWRVHARFPMRTH
jgi:signal transduction histidine kinase